MISRKLESKVFLVALLALGVQVNSLVAQESRVLEPKNTALSVNPFGMMLDLFNAEIERVASPTSTIGFGGSGFFGGEGEGSMGRPGVYQCGHFLAVLSLRNTSPGMDVRCEDRYDKRRY